MSPASFLSNSTIRHSPDWISSLLCPLVTGKYRALKKALGKDRWILYLTLACSHAKGTWDRSEMPNKPFMGPCLEKAFAFFVFFTLHILYSRGMVGISYRLFRQEDEQLHLYHSTRRRKKIRALCMHTPETWHSQESNIVSITAH